MNKFKITLVLLTTVSVFITAQPKKIDLNGSVIKWVGKSAVLQQEGTVKFGEGTVMLKNNKLVGGTFVADMTTIGSNLAENSGKAKLEEHLKSDDFFSVSKFKTAKLVIKKYGRKSDTEINITADLTIKGKTESVSFVIHEKDNTLTAKVIFDRSKFDIRYASKSFFEDIGDKIIYDEVEFNVVVKY